MGTRRVLVVGLGPAGADLMPEGTRRVLEAVPPAARFLRTGRHPAASAAGGAATFDALYESAPSLEDVYVGIVDALMAAATAHGEVVYAVPGSPAVAERTVVLLLERAAAGDVRVDVVPALSFLDLAWARLGADPVAEGVRVVDGHRFAVAASGERGPLLVAQCDTRAVLSEIKLAIDLDGPPVTVLQRLGLPDEAVFACERAELDRSFEPDHLTSLYLATAAPAVAAAVARFDDLVHLLRQRCPWDQRQTHASLTRHLLEETYEVLDAIGHLDPETGDGDDDLLEELGDLLFQICFHSTLAGERGAFTLADVAQGIHDKLVHRHPHVFGDGAVPWEELKQAEKARASVFDGIPAALPALAYGAKVLGRAASLGVTLPAPAPGLADAEAVGAALLAVVAAARVHDVDPEAALRAAVERVRDHARVSEAGQG